MTTQSDQRTLKQVMLDALQELEDEPDFLDVIDRLLLVYKIRLAMKHADEGQLIPHEEMKRQMEKWLQ
jgi:hypothetical protein